MYDVGTNVNVYYFLFFLVLFDGVLKEGKKSKYSKFKPI